MGKVDEFNLLLNRPDNAYKNGEVVSGNLNFKISERLKIKSLTLNIVGEANTDWSETYSTGKGTVTVHYHGNEDYVRNTVTFLQKENNEDLFIEPGDWNYPFEYKLPENIPSTMSYSDGKINYHVEARLEIPW